MGRALDIFPTVVGARWRFNSHSICNFPFISTLILSLETEPAANLFNEVYELYNASPDFQFLSKKQKVKLSSDNKEKEELKEREAKIKEIRILSKFSKKDLKNITDEEIIALEKMQEVIDAREIIGQDEPHEPVEIEVSGKGKMTIGPPGLTKFEKARIVGTRALQLSQGAPPFINVPKGVTAGISLAMEELESGVLPITIRRVLPNGDFQNIPLESFIKL